ncbi:MAG: Fic family protein [Planctomycetota bacterium]
MYQIDRGVTVLLIEQGLDASLIPYGTTDKPAQEVIEIVQSHNDTLEGLFAFVRGERKLTKNYICEIHQQITRHQSTVTARDGQGRLVERPMSHGRFKQWPNNPMIPGKGLHEYCPPEQVDSEMDRLVLLHEQHEAADVSPDVESAWLHHRFTQVHPFEDGNGRVARAIASLVLIRRGLFPLLVTRDERKAYLEALSEADRGNLSALVQLFAKAQRMCLRKALSVSEDVLAAHAAKERILAAAVEQLAERNRDLQSRQRNVIGFSGRLEEIAAHELGSLAREIDSQLKPVDPGFRAVQDSSYEGQVHWFRSQIIDIAKRFDYFADTRTYAAWQRLRIFESRQTSIVVSFHCLGTSFSGTMACVAFVEHRDITDAAGQFTRDGPYPAMPDIFQFTYLDNPEALEGQFRKWLSQTINFALEQWRKQL